MKDRIPTYPGRVKLVPVAGQANVYDMVRADEPVEAGTPLNKATLLTDQTATKLGLDLETATPDKAFEMLANKMIDKLVFVKIKQSTTWTAPKAVNQLFKVFVVGGGGGGGYRGSGGGSGYLTIKARTITENTPVEIICGAGGAAGTEDSTKGIDGGQTSFDDIIALGGKGGDRDGGDGLAGGGGYGGKGGNGAFGGGGGGTSHSSKGQGGNGGTYGGGGGGGYYDTPNNGGTGGTYGGGGGASEQNGENGYTFNDTYLNILFNTAAIQQGLAGESAAYSNNPGGGGGGGYGGNGGKGGTYGGAGGGGGGYCGNGGNAFSAGGGGGGYCGNGGNAPAGNGSGGGGGGGFFSNGGDGSYDICGGGGGGFFHNGGINDTELEVTEQYNGTKGLGGNGGVLIMYFKED